MLNILITSIICLFSLSSGRINYEQKEKECKPIQNQSVYVSWIGNLRVEGLANFFGSLGYNLFTNYIQNIAPPDGFSSKWTNISHNTNYSATYTAELDSNDYFRLGNYKDYLNSNTYQNNVWTSDIFRNITKIVFDASRTPSVTYTTNRATFYNLHQNIGYIQWSRYDLPSADDTTTYTGELISGGTNINSSQFAFVFKDNSFFYQNYELLLSNEYATGYSVGYIKGRIDAYNGGYDEGDRVGYQRGYTEGILYAQRQNDTALTIFTGIVDVGLLPINVFLNMFNYEVFGINISGLVASMLTIAIVVIVVRIILGGNKND